MNQLRLLAPLFAACLLVPQGVAQDRESDHDALRALRERLLSALGGTDADALAACFTPQFVFTGSDQSVATSRDELAAYYAEWFEGEDARLVKMEVSAEADVPTVFTGEDTGFSYGTGVITYHLTAGPVVPIPSRWTASVRKLDGEWRVETAHVGVNILENPVMKARVGLWRTATYAAAAGGVLVGLILARIFRKKQAAA